MYASGMARTLRSFATYRISKIDSLESQVGQNAGRWYSPRISHRIRLRRTVQERVILGICI
jgi:hypothetical protein